VAYLISKNTTKHFIRVSQQQGINSSWSHPFTSFIYSCCCWYCKCFR